MKAKLVTLIVSAAFFTLASQTVAMPKSDTNDPPLPYSQTYETCRAEAEDQIDLGNCHEDEYMRWDDELNATYKRVMATLSPARKAILRQEQRGWLKGIEACTGPDFEAKFRDQNLINGSRCELEATVRRTLYLRAYH